MIINGIFAGKELFMESVDYDVLDEFDDALQEGIEQLRKLAPGSNEYRTQAESIAALYRARIEDAKVAVDKENKDNLLKQSRESDHKQFMMKCADIAVQISLGLAGLVFYNVWNRRGYKFEENGTITSKTFNRSLQDVKIPKLGR